MLTEKVFAFGSALLRISEVNLTSVAADTIDSSRKYYNEVKLPGPSSQISLFTLKVLAPNKKGQTKLFLKTKIFDSLVFHLDI